MLGRDNDLALLGELLSRTRQDRRPHLVTVLGDAGVGKSRLVREFARKTDAVVRLGRCLPYGDSIEFHAIRSVIKDEASIGPDEDTNAAANKLKAHVLALCSGANGPAVADRLVVLAGLAEAGVLLAGVSSEDLMTELGWAFQTFIARVASTRPLLLIFEDVHWATPRILDLIEGLTHGPDGMLLVCCIARPELVESRPTWGTQSPHASTVRLRPLDMTAAQRLVLELLQVEDLPRSLVADIADRSGGNPLYVEEILRALIASGHLRRSAGGWEAASSTTPTDVPDTLRGVITARLDRLSPSTKRLLQHGSALGRFFPLRGVRALGAEEPTSAHAVQEAIRSDFLVVTDEAPSPEGPRYHFRHALIRDAVYGSIPKQHRRRLHERAADWLEREVERGDDAAERVAYHLEQAFTLAAESRDVDVASIGRRAYAALTALATRERQMHTFLDSTPFYERAERIASGIGIPVAERKDDIAWYACARHGPKHADADQSDLFDTLALVRDLGPTTGLAQLLGFASRHAGPAALAMAAESLTVARATGDPAAIGWALWYMRHASDPADRETDRRLLEETLSIAQEHDLKDLLPFALMAVAERAIQEGDLGRARQIHEEAYAGALASGAKRVLAHAAIRLALDHARVRELARMTTLIDEAIAAARQTANPEVIAAVLRQAAPAELENGMQERGNAHAEELAALGQVTR